MLETASVKREEAMDELDEIRKRRKSLDKSTRKLLDQALPSKETSKSKRKLESEEKSQKKLKVNVKQKVISDTRGMRGVSYL